MDDLTLKGNVIEAVSKVIDPQQAKSILDSHLLDAVNVKDGVVEIRLTFPADYPKEARWKVEDAVADAAEAIKNVGDVNVHGFVSGEEPYKGAQAMGSSAQSSAPPPTASASEAAGGMAADAGGASAGAAAGQQAQALNGVGRVIAVASGKGGVGKSTVAVNLALALQRLGYRVGLLDVDVYGPSVPTLLGVNERPSVRNKRIIPLEAYHLRLMSLGFLMEDDSPVIWRGPIVTGIVRQFLQDVDWSGTDYLIIDMPPGTGDAQLSLAQAVPVDGAVVVTTPSDLALIDAARGLRMFNTLNIDVLGIVENMSWYVWEGIRELRPLVEDVRKDNPELADRFDKVISENERSYIFGRGGGQREAERLETNFLGQIPLDGAVRKAGDEGRPIVVADPESPTTDAFLDLARAVMQARPIEEDGDAKKGLFSFLKN